MDLLLSHMSMAGYHSESICNRDKYKYGLVDMFSTQNFVCVLKVDPGILGGEAAVVAVVVNVVATFDVCRQGH